jgi:hypothetical protein
MKVDDGVVRDCVGEAGAGATCRPCPLLLHPPWNHGVPQQQGLHLREHVAAPDKFVLRVQTPGI